MIPAVCGAFRAHAALGLVLLAAGCADPVWAPDAEVAAARHADPGPPAITLITAQYSNGEGKHSALMINASERVIFDPAGSWYQPGVPERNDVLHGITPRILDIYTDFYARENQHVVMQTVEVSPEAAERALDLVQAYGAVGNARCTLSTTEILGQTPGFEDTPRRLWPQRAMREFAARPGVRTEILYGPDGRAPDPVVVWGRQGQPAAGS
jgi:hypothetical protein